MANRVFRYEFQQGWIPKVVTTHKHDTLMRQMGMSLQMRMKAYRLTRIKQIHRAAKHLVFDSFLVW